MSDNATTTPASTPAEVPQVLEDIKIPESENQWQLVIREFRRRRLAVVAYYIILLLLTVSIFAPFLANDRPLVYRGVNHRQYREANRNISAVIGGQLRAIAAGASSEFQDPVGIVRQQMAMMAEQLPAENAAELELIHGQLVDLLVSPDRGPDTVQTLTAIRTQLRRDFAARKVTLVKATHWPVLRSLSWMAVILIVANMLFLLRPLWKWPLSWWLADATLRTRTLVQLAILVGLPLLSGIGWWMTVPARVDLTKYKQAVFHSEESGARTVDVVYDWAVWPAVPFALDESDLEAKYLKPGVWSPADLKRQTAGTLRPWHKPHWLGTDGIGRDTACRMIWGGRVSMAVGIVAVSIYVTIGIIVGALAGYFRGKCDLVISRLIEIVICFPSFFLILTLVAFMGPSIFKIMIVIGLTAWTGIARLVRGEFLRLGEQEFVLAGRALGYSPPRIIFRHVLPNALAPVLVSATFGIAGAILTESGLSFLGFGITVPRPSWGGILSSGRNAIFRAPWLIYFPGLAIFLTITAYNLVGEALRDAADPRLRGQHASD